MLLEGDRSICRLKECNLGNFFADALVDAQVKNPSTEQWAETVLAIWNGGGIRSGNIDKRFDGKLSRLIRSWLTFLTRLNPAFVDFFFSDRKPVKLKGKMSKELVKNYA